MSHSKLAGSYLIGCGHTGAIGVLSSVVVATRADKGAEAIVRECEPYERTRFVNRRFTAARPTFKSVADKTATVLTCRRSVKRPMEMPPAPLVGKQTLLPYSKEAHSWCQATLDHYAVSCQCDGNAGIL